MHSALVIVQKPEDVDPVVPSSVAMAWGQYLGSQTAAANDNKGAIEVLGEGCVQITLDKGADALAHVLHAASRSRLPYRVLFFEKAPQWVRSGSAPRTR